jgi:hypothetical protein
VKFIDINLEEFYRSNDYEGTRLGAGFSTNDKLSKVIYFDGFAGYGIKDREFKYGGHLALTLGKNRETEFRFSYQNNLKEPGIDELGKFEILSLSEYFRNYIAWRMDSFIEERVEFSFRLSRFLKISSALSMREIKPTYEYEYKGLPFTDFFADEFKISARFAYGEEIHMFGNQRVVYYEGNPVFTVDYKRGIDLFDRESYNYNRLEAILDVRAYKGRLGQTNIRFTGGYIDKPLPYSLLFTGEGSKSYYPILINNTFQTMKPYEFLSDRYFNIFFTHNFGSLLLETRRFKPRFVVAHNTGWGTLRNSSDHGIDFKTKEKIYLESGLLINNIIRFRIFNLYYVGFGGGTFYRYGHYGYDKVFDNLALKASITVALE